jgi:hypothetical protein
VCVNCTRLSRVTFEHSWYFSVEIVPAAQLTTLTNELSTGGSLFSSSQFPNWLRYSTQYVKGSTSLQLTIHFHLWCPGLPQKAPPFFSVFCWSISILIFLISVMCPSGRHPPFMVVPLVLYYGISH